jgi:hypothetical protein
MRLRPKNKYYEIGNPEFYILRTLGKLAMEKAIQVDQVIATPKAEKIVNKVAKALVLAAAVIFGIPVLIQVVKWYFF